ncbi:MAG: hypothetical protein QXS54_00350 [Candidatus Methanomethylicaceae archaeon]
MTRVLLSSVFLLLSAPALAQPAQRIPPIGEIMMSSPDAASIVDNCTLSFNKTSRRFQCSRRIDVALSNGRQTIVQLQGIRPSNKIFCGCWLGCNQYGMVLGYLMVDSIGDGWFRIRHAYALGNEVVSCAVY